MENDNRPTKKTKKNRLSWKVDGLDKTFLDACIHEVTINGQLGGSLKGNSWKNVAEKLKKEHNFIADQKQMKNRYDYLKAKFGAWLKLKNKTGNVYDPISNSFKLTDEEWELEIKANKYVEHLRNAPLQHPELYCQLFEGSTCNGFDSWGPGSTLPHPDEDTEDPVLNEGDDFPLSPQEPFSSQEACSTRVQNKKRKEKETIQSKIIEVGNEITKSLKTLVERDDSKVCLEKLNTFGWGKKDPMYQAALMLFSEKVEYQKFFINLEPECCEDWIKMAGRKHGLLD